jgi:predicted dinucleotide-binding enzyme
MRIAILGTGTAGTTLATGLVAAGHDVVFGSRTPTTKTDLPAPAVTIADAISGADLVVSALPGAAALAALTDLKEELVGHVLLDLSNAVTPQFDLVYPNASLGAALQAALPQTKVVKSINTLAISTLIAPDDLASPTQLFLSGDDAAAKAVVAEMLVSLGWPSEQQLDLGGIETARGPEHWFLLFFGIMRAGGPFNLAIVR